MAMGVSGGGGGRRGRGRRRAPMAEINVTPLVDVMLVLLIVFMVTAPLLVANVPINLPDSRAAPTPASQLDAIPLSLDAEGKIYLDDEWIQPVQLPQKLAQLRADYADEPGGPRVLVRADRVLDYGQVMRVMGEIQRAGITKVSLVTVGSSE